ncbi:hypothetical protein [Prochlorococcus sp. MIT 0801]|uniref:hypothetical protein n=1 Tax=Prochlorococcus sp. MIT 0801 TaxID=1501269 RepID=UPI0004F710D1|nr:hypothetical protein [Prochlorococcus sp. MIT 0801]AIQ96208.1 hypothetical protein EW15_0116 [Prochlorococcus sp. MIT 0801]
MKINTKESFIVIILGFFVIFFLQISISQALELDLTAAQNAVGKRFASKFCEAKEKGFSSESSSEFALNNTYLKFVAFPEDDKFLEDLWEFTIGRIRNDCGTYVTNNEEAILRDFFKEEGEIASNRDLYLPH